MNHPMTSEFITKPKRPIGVWILSIYAIIFAGILPLLALFAIKRSGFNLSVFEALFPIILAIGIIVSSIGTWQGSNKARISLMVLITVHYVLIAINNTSLLVSGSVRSDVQPQMIGRIIRGIFYPATYIWYFRRPTTMLFYSERDG